MSIQYSIIISTYKREQSLSRCLKCLSKIKKPPIEFEVLVMDNGCSEESKKVVETFLTQIPNLKYYSVQPPGLHVCRNLGYERAQGDILCYLDDDSFVEPTWLAGISEAFLNPEVVLVGGKIVPDFEIPPPTWVDKLWKFSELGKHLAQYSLIDFGDDDFFIPAGFIWGCNFSIRKKILSECRGFHPDSFPDSLIQFRGDGESSVSRYIDQKKHLAFYSGKATVLHLVSRERLTFDYLYRRSYHQGISDSYTLLRTLRGSLTNYRFHCVYWKISHWIRYFRQFIQAGDRSLNRSLDRGYWDGFRFHRKQIKQNPKLIDWILLIDYFGEKGSQLEQYYS